MNYNADPAKMQLFSVNLPVNRLHAVAL
jgi:hypothetical protein